MNPRIQEKRNTLRTEITREVEHYLGHAEDVHNDHITVDMDTAEVGYQSHLIDERNNNLHYYDVLDLIKQDGCWFKPDKQAIEALVQSLFPCSEVADFALNLKNSIIKFLDKEKPTSLRPYKVSITTGSHRIDCYNPDEVEEDTSEDIDPEEDFEAYMEQLSQYESFDEYPMRKFVRVIEGDYYFNDYQLTKAALNYIKV